MRKLSNKKIVLSLLALALVSFGTLLVWVSLIKLPDLSNFAARKIANSSKIVDRTGEIVLYDINQGVRRTEIPLSEMGENIKNASISIEDENFYTHKGIRPTSIIRAIWVNITSRSLSQGGSTITQQIIKNTLLNTDKKFTRKIKEWALALKLEKYFTKDQILEIYLNDNPYGGTIYGVEEASIAFLNKSSKDLTVAEAAYLAAIPQAPTYYSPFGKNKDKLETRKNTVLKKMNSLGYINDEQYETAKNEVVVFNTQAQNSIKAPHFVFYILDYLQERYGKDVMENGGFTITTTIDYELQKKAEEIVLNNALKNEKALNASNSSLLALDPKTGQVLAMVGSRDYFDKNIDGAYNIITAKRQPGSSFKPFVYAAGFQKGYTPETILFDVNTEFSTSCVSNPESCYNPDDFDGLFKGPLSVRSALAESRNVPAVKMLYLVGLDDALSMAKTLGISGLGDKSRYGLSLVLGGGEVSLLDMTSAYGVFANNGVKNRTTGILSVKDNKGNIVEEFEQSETQAIDTNVALNINSILSDTVARAPTFGSTYNTPFESAFKTGTTNDNKDAWIVGYTPTIVVGVWSGNNDNKPMKKGGSAVSGPTWKEFIQEVVKKYPTTPFEKPTPDPDYSSLKPVLRGVWMGNKTVFIDKVTGKLATTETPIESREERVVTDVQDILYWVDKSNPRGPIPENPYKDPQFSLWNSAVQSWWQQNKYKYNITTENDLPIDYETVHTEENKPSLRIIGLSEKVKQNENINISILNNQTQYPVTSVDIFINNNYLTTLSGSFKFIFNPKEYGYLPGNYVFKAVGTNNIFLKNTIEQNFEII
ncbi:MAG: PBP1A family penicillin-binding protein [Candidatus Pacebacteria bacterium]|nr:PBP1A family penicillin-binding protein [Candidatus Paceibacterota bacterium]